MTDLPALRGTATPDRPLADLTWMRVGGPAEWLVQPADALWKPPAITMSGLEGTGLDEFWAVVLDHQRTLDDAGELAAKRARQQVGWTWAMVREQLLGRLSDHPGVKALRRDTEEEVRAGTLTAALAAQRILDAFDHA